VYWNLLPLPLLYLSAFFERRRQAYYDWLQAIRVDGAWRDFIFFFLSGVQEQAFDAIERAKKLIDLGAEWRQQLQQARMSGLILGIVDFLFERPIVSVDELRERFDVSHPAAMAAVRRLEEMEILHEITGKPRNRVYLAKAILTIFE